MASSFYESFDKGTGSLETWGGKNVDTSVRGQVTLHDNSGIIERGAGHGYGTYTITAKMGGNEVGPAALLWPSNDKWPGPEIDLAEFVSGRPYGTLHWKNSNGGDSYKSVYYDGVDETQKHTYKVDWQPGKLTFSVDGQVRGVLTDHVPKDAAHGGVNEVFSANNWNHDTWITIYDMSYKPTGGDNVW